MLILKFLELKDVNELIWFADIIPEPVGLIKELYQLKSLCNSHQIVFSEQI